MNVNDLMNWAKANKRTDAQIITDLYAHAIRVEESRDDLASALRHYQPDHIALWRAEQRWEDVL